MVTDRAQIFFLAQCFGANRAALGGDRHKILGKLLHTLFFACAGKADAISNGLFLQRGMVLQKRKHTVNSLRRAGHAFRFAHQFQL